MVITATPQSADRIRDDLATWLDSREALVFPIMELVPFDILAHSPEVPAQRLKVLEKLAQGQNPVVVAPVASLMRALTPPEIFAHACRTIRWGDQIDLERFLTDLADAGYERVELVESWGQFSLRGGILDLFPMSADRPYRLELFDNEVDSIREFDPATQRSVGKVKSVFLAPAREAVLPRKDREAVVRAIRREVETVQSKLARLGKETGLARLRERTEAHLEKLSEGISFSGNDYYLPYFYKSMSSLFDYFPGNLLVLIDDPSRIRESAETAEKLNREREVSLAEQGGLLPSQGRLQVGWNDLQFALSKRASVSFSLLPRKSQIAEPKNVVSVACKPMTSFHGQWPLFADELGRLKEGKYLTLMVVQSEERVGRIKESLREAEIEPQNIITAVGNLETGFQWPALRLAVVAEADIFGKPKVRRRAPGKTDDRGSVRIGSYRDLNVGDFVVHVNHGIGRYLGIKTLEVEGVHKDYLFVKYEGADRLYVPTDQIDLIQKYVGSEGHEPKLYKLGGVEWQKVKSRVKESIQKMAVELLRLEAARESRPGNAFSPDTTWQREFEDSFKFEETPDQIKAAEEIKRDMEKPRPMDRLLCGDVGYGKTEVAIRAVFKAVMDSKQVAVLVPTTILAQQHYNTFRERFAGYPVRIGLLNRFRTAAEQAATLENLTAGEIDVVIGTHRLLSEDVRFRDLGLLVVDEEQRFGVGHKEKIKQLRQNVDVLTLSATPIPRTLHMSLVGMRDMSTIDTPPDDRFPVQTFVAEYSDALVRDAVYRETSRGGQCYFLYNRVATIEKAASRLQRLIPEARIAVAHGQMKEDQLESIMVAFLEGEYDVLCCTTIIESGLDIPNVNTIIVEEADHLGLAQLYQLRGRVGRSNRLAYAFFLYRKDKVLSEVAEKRLSAIREFTEFGSGLKIALRDLEIRGAGNILGPEQHGFIISVGFDLYCQLMEETIKELKGEKTDPEPEPSIELAIDAYISDGYILDPKQKIEAYQRIMAIREPRDAGDVEEELTDRYGNLPRSVVNLLAVARLKSFCRWIGVMSINQQRERITIKFRNGIRPSPEILVALQRKYKGRISLGSGKMLSLVFKATGLRTEEVLDSLDSIIRSFDTIAT